MHVRVESSIVIPNNIFDNVTIYSAAKFGGIWVMREITQTRNGHRRRGNRYSSNTPSTVSQTIITEKVARDQGRGDWSTSALATEWKTPRQFRRHKNTRPSPIASSLPLPIHFEADIRDAEVRIPLFPFVMDLLQPAKQNGNFLLTNRQPFDPLYGECYTEAGRRVLFVSSPIHFGACGSGATRRNN